MSALALYILYIQYNIGYCIYYIIFYILLMTLFNSLKRSPAEQYGLLSNVLFAFAAGFGEAHVCSSFFTMSNHYIHGKTQTQQ